MIFAVAGRILMTEAKLSELFDNSTIRIIPQGVFNVKDYNYYREVKGMNDPEDHAIRAMIAEALEICHNTDLLDLILKLLIYDCKR